MFRAALFIIAKKWKQHKCPSTGKWINKMQFIYTMEQFLALKMNGVLVHATYSILQHARMSLENIMLNEIVRKDDVLYDFIYIKCPEQAVPRRII